MKKRKVKKRKAKPKVKSKQKLRTRKKNIKVLSTKERKELQEMFRESLTFD